jgi:hypothetical protein
MSTERLCRITPAETRLIHAAMHCFELDETKGEAVHLQVREGSRTWLMENRMGQFTIDIADEECRDLARGSWPLPERFRRFADFFDDRPLSLDLVDGSTLMVGGPSVSAAIDLVAQRGPAPTPRLLQPSAMVDVPARQFLYLLWSARTMPSGVDTASYAAPPMWMQIGEGWLGLHVDWSDFVPSRATYRLAVNGQTGFTTASIPHRFMDEFLSLAPLLDDDGDELELTIAVGVVDDDERSREAVQLSCGEWQLTLWLLHPLGSRWGVKVLEALESVAERDDHSLECTDGDLSEWRVRAPEVDVWVKLHAGHPDVVRVSATVLTHAGESIDLLRELLQLNTAAVGIRYSFENGVVRALADLRCTELASLPAMVDAVANAARIYRPMLAAFVTA